MNLTRKDTLSVAAAALKQAAPNSYEIFCKAFDAYSADLKDEYVQATPDKIFSIQGRVQECSLLSTLFRNAATTADHLTVRQQRQQQK